MDPQKHIKQLQKLLADERALVAVLRARLKDKDEIIRAIADLARED